MFLNQFGSEMNAFEEGREKRAQKEQTLILFQNVCLKISK